MATGIRTKLLETSESQNQVGTAINNDDDDDYHTADGKISLGKLLQKIKDSQRSQSDDNFRA